MTSGVKGRPPSVEPRTAYDVRRYLTLVQVLALEETAEGRLSGLRHLARQWGVPDAGEYRELVSRLAQHVTEYHRLR